MALAGGTSAIVIRLNFLFLLSNETALVGGTSAIVIRLTFLFLLSNETALAGGTSTTVIRLTLLLLLVLRDGAGRRHLRHSHPVDTLFLPCYIYVHSYELFCAKFIV